MSKKSYYWVGKQELKQYVNSDPSPSLFVFLHINKHLFYNHTFETVDSLRYEWRKRFLRYCAHGSTVVQTAYWDRLFGLNKITANVVETILFQYFYFKFTKNTNLPNFKTIITPIVSNYFEQTPNNLKTKLQKMSYNLLEKDEKLTTPQEAALKLSLSGIVDLCDTKIMDVYKQNMSDADWSSMDDTHESLLNAEDKDFIVQFANAAAHIGSTYGKDVLSALLSQTRANIEIRQLAGNHEDHTLQMQLIKLYQYVLDSMEYWNNADDTEDEYVFRVKEMWKKISTDFIESKIKLKSGECTSKATKQIKLFNDYHFAECQESRFCRSPAFIQSQRISSADTSSNTPSKILSDITNNVERPAKRLKQVPPNEAQEKTDTTTNDVAPSSIVALLDYQSSTTLQSYNQQQQQQHQSSTVSVAKIKRNIDIVDASTHVDLSDEQDNHYYTALSSSSSQFDPTSKNSTPTHSNNNIENEGVSLSPTLGQLSNSITANTTNTTSSITSHTITNTDTQAETNATTSSNVTTNTDATGSKSNNNRMGKRVDLSFYGTNDMELSFSEFKPPLPTSEENKLCTQESKALRDNQAIHKNLEEMGVNQKDYTLCTLWHGMQGKLVKTTYDANVAIAKPMGDLVVPHNVSLLSKFKDTVLIFFEYKEFNKQLNTSIMDLLSGNNNLELPPPPPTMPHTISSPYR